MRFRPDRAIQTTASHQETAVGETDGLVPAVGRLLPDVDRSGASTRGGSASDRSRANSVQTLPWREMTTHGYP